MIGSERGIAAFCFLQVCLLRSRASGKSKYRSSPRRPNFRPLSFPKCQGGRCYLGASQFFFFFFDLFQKKLDSGMCYLINDIYRLLPVPSFFLSRHDVRLSHHIADLFLSLCAVFVWSFSLSFQLFVIIAPISESSGRPNFLFGRFFLLLCFPFTCAHTILPLLLATFSFSSEDNNQSTSGRLLCQPLSHPAQKVLFDFFFFLPL